MYDYSTGSWAVLAATEGLFEFFEGVIADPAAVENSIANVELVFHLATKVSVPESFEKTAEYELVNVRGTAVLLSAARKAGVRRAVLLSTCAVYLNTTELPVHTN